MSAPSPRDLVALPSARGRASIELTGRRTQSRWSVRVELLLLAAVPLTPTRSPRAGWAR